MFRKRARIAGASIALVAATALALAGCSSSGSSEESAASGTGIVTANGSEPQMGLVPTNTAETGGGRIIDELFAGLYYYDASGKPQPDVAESVESDDQQNWTIKIKADKTFSNGEKVTAKSFVDAWNFGANTANGQLQQYFFESIEGYDDENPVEAMSGLQVVDDTTFTVKLSQPEADFPLRLGFSAYYPLPSEALTDIDAFGQNPIGNGPYKLASDSAWQHNVQIDLVPNDSYDGPRKPKNGGITFKFYQELDAAYSDLQADNLDVIDQVPSSSLASYKDDLGDRAVEAPMAGIQTITIPVNLAHFAEDDEGKLRRQAISYAIDRDSITDQIFQGSRTPAKDFTSDALDGFDDSIDGSEVLNYDEQKAKDLWAQADAISPWSGTFEIAYNADGGHQEWVDATANSIKNVLGIDAKGKPYPDFKSLRTDATNKTINAALRSGWQADYPSLYNFLGPLYATGAGANDADYSNPEFDQAVSDALGQSTIEEANSKLNDSQKILFEDLPAIPLWYYAVNGGYSSAVSNVEYGWNGVPLYDQIAK